MLSSVQVSINLGYLCRVDLVSLGLDVELSDWSGYFSALVYCILEALSSAILMIYIKN